MSARNCRFQPMWLDHIDKMGLRLSLWCEKRDNAAGEVAFCRVCPQEMKISAKGFQALKQHYETQKHCAAKVKLSPSQCVIATGRGPEAPSTTAPSSATLLAAFSRSEMVLRAEVGYVLRKAALHESGNSCAYAGDFLRWIFPDSQIVKDFLMNPKKFMIFMNMAISPFLKQDLLQELGGSY